MALTYTPFENLQTLGVVMNTLNDFNESVVAEVNGVAIAAAAAQQLSKRLVGLIPSEATVNTLVANVPVTLASSDPVLFEAGKKYIVEARSSIRAVDTKRHFSICVGGEILTTTLIFSQSGDVEMRSSLVGVYQPLSDTTQTVDIEVVSEKNISEAITGVGTIIFTVEEVN